jgi:hypothetical protein
MLKFFLGLVLVLISPAVFFAANQVAAMGYGLLNGVIIVVGFIMLFGGLFIFDKDLKKLMIDTREMKARNTKPSNSRATVLIPLSAGLLVLSFWIIGESLNYIDLPQDKPFALSLAGLYADLAAFVVCIYGVRFTTIHPYFYTIIFIITLPLLITILSIMFPTDYGFGPGVANPFP